jgi:excisionase family DNA binding protein
VPQRRLAPPGRIFGYLSVSEPQAYALVRSGDLPAIKIGGRGVWRVDRRRLEAFVEQLHDETARWVAEHPLGAEQREAQGLRIVGVRPLPDEGEAVTTAEAARMIGVTRQNVTHLVRTGSLRARKDGKRWLISADDTRAYRSLDRARHPDVAADRS